MNQTTKQPTEVFAASIATILDAVGEEHDRERETDAHQRSGS